MNKFLFGEDRLTVGKALKICAGVLPATIGRSAIKNIDRSKNCVDRIVESQNVVYGINTGFGPLCTTII